MHPPSPTQKRDDNPKHLCITFNACSGTDLLWASLLEQMWSGVEKEFGPFKLRLHRASIRLAQDDLADENVEVGNLQTRQQKRSVALLPPFELILFSRSLACPQLQIFS